MPLVARKPRRQERRPGKRSEPGSTAESASLPGQVTWSFDRIPIAAPRVPESSRVSEDVSGWSVGGEPPVQRVKWNEKKKEKLSSKMKKLGYPTDAISRVLEKATNEDKKELVNKIKDEIARLDAPSVRSEEPVVDPESPPISTTPGDSKTAVAAEIEDWRAFKGFGTNERSLLDEAQHFLKYYERVTPKELAGEEWAPHGEPEQDVASPEAIDEPPALISFEEDEPPSSTPLDEQVMIADEPLPPTAEKKRRKKASERNSDRQLEPENIKSYTKVIVNKLEQFNLQVKDKIEQRDSLSPREKRQVAGALDLVTDYVVRRVGAWASDPKKEGFRLLIGGIAREVEETIVPMALEQMTSTLEELIPKGNQAKYRASEVAEGALDIGFNVAGTVADTVTATLSTPGVAAVGTSYKAGIAAARAKNQGMRLPKITVISFATFTVEFLQGMCPFLGTAWGIMGGVRSISRGTGISNLMRKTRKSRSYTPISARKAGNRKIGSLLSVRLVYLNGLIERLEDKRTSSLAARTVALESAEEQTERTAPLELENPEQPAEWEPLTTQRFDVLIRQLRAEKEKLEAWDYQKKKRVAKLNPLKDSLLRS